MGDEKSNGALGAQTADYLEGLMEGFVAYDQDWPMTYINDAGERHLVKPVALESLQRVLATL